MSDFDQQANDHAIAVTTQLFRLIRSARMHDVAALLAQGTLETAAQNLKELAREAGGFVVVMFADETVFVNGQPIRAPRAVYDKVLAVGEALLALGFNEVTLRATLSAEDLAQLLRLINGERTVSLPSSITLQSVDPSTVLGATDGEQSIVNQVAAVYGAATVLVRRCDDQIREDNPRLMRHVKRVSQRLVTLTRTGFPELLALARRPASPSDHAAISVNAAVIGALTGRALTGDVHTLLRITMAALQADIGKARVAGMYRADGFNTSFIPELNRQMRQRLPASTAVMLLQAGRAAERPLMRAVVAYETAHLADGALLGWPYKGRVPPTVEAVVGSVARRVAVGITNASGPDDLVRTLANTELGKIERAGLDLVFSVLGLLPIATPVEMTTGWRGVVLSSGDDFSALERAHVVLLLDAHRRPVEPRVVRAGGEYGWVKGAVLRSDEELSKCYETYVAQHGRDDYDLPATTGVLEPEFGDHLQDRATLDFDSEAASSMIDTAVADRFRREIAQDVPPTVIQESSVPPQFSARPATGNAEGLPRQFQTAAPTRANTPAPPDEDVDAPPTEAEPKPGDGTSEDGDFDALANIVLFD